MSKPTLAIRQDGDPILLKRSLPVQVPEEFNDTLSKLIKAMRRAMVKHKGSGLSAVQVSVLTRVVVTNQALCPTLINPVITLRSEETGEGYEGCLSIPGWRFRVTRSKWIEVEFYDERFKRRNLRLVGTGARIVQHEIDHLDGVTIDQIGTPV